MAHLWIQANGSWQPASLSGESDALQPSRLRAAGAEWVLLARPGEVAVNGAPVLSGVRVLRDRDELVLRGGAQFFFSTERLAAIEPFPGAKAIPCPRCREPIEPGTSAVRCPLCTLWMHENEKRKCWTYAPKCHCPQPTALDAGFAWSPEDL